MPSPSVKTVRGVAVPTMGFGVFEVEPGETEEAVFDALAAGYRHVDTAVIYGNEAEVGRALASSDVDRSEVWLTTKVWMNAFAPDRLRASAEESLARLGTDYVDLLLLHWPPSEPGELAPALEELQRLRADGLIRELGVSNFPGYLLRDALAVTDEIFANQVEYHARLSQRELLSLADEHDLLIEAYAPLGGSAAKIIDDPLLEEIAASRGVSAAQVALAWLARQERVVLLPRSTSAERRRQNLAALEVDLSDDEVARIDSLSEERKRNFDPPFAPDWRD